MNSSQVRSLTTVKSQKHKCQITSGQMKSSQIRSDKVKLGLEPVIYQILNLITQKSGYVKLEQVKSGEVKSDEVP